MDLLELAERAGWPANLRIHRGVYVRGGSGIAWGTFITKASEEEREAARMALERLQAVQE